MRKIGIVTVGRSDLATFTPVIEKILERDDLQLYLYVSGAHLSPEFGSTAIEIAQKGWKVTDFIEIGLSSDTPQAMAKALGLGVIALRAGLLSPSPGYPDGAWRPLRDVGRRAGSRAV